MVTVASRQLGSMIGAASAPTPAAAPGTAPLSMTTLRSAS
jgi:hypothetical protein